MTFDEIIRCLSIGDQKIIQEMITLFDGIDRQTSNFARQTGLHCKAGCGACCTNPDIETTVAEVLPLAVYLWSQNLSPSKLEAIRLNASKGVCVFYQPDGLHSGSGRCGIYAYRPGLCRLFGFAARKDKHEQRMLVTCKVIKDSQPQACKSTQEELDKGLEAPSLAAHAFAVSNIDRVHGMKLLPINQAITQAVEKVGYSIQQQKLPIPPK
jgi:Fe-S-cluster containining protein